MSPVALGQQQPANSCAQQARESARLVADLNADATGAAGDQPLVLGDAGLARLPLGLATDAVVDERGNITFFGQRVNGRPKALRKALRDAVDAEQKKIDLVTRAGGKALPSPQARPLVLAVHPEAPWSAVVALLAARPATFDDRVRWVFRVPSRTQAPPATWVRKSVEGKALQARLTAVRQASSKVAASCPSYRALLDKMTRAPAARARGLLAKRVEQSLTDCDCKADHPALQDLLYVTLHVGAPVGFVQTRVPLDGSGEVLSATGRRRFQLIAPRLLELAETGSALSVSAR